MVWEWRMLDSLEEREVEMGRGHEASGENGYAYDAGSKGERDAAQSPLRYFTQGKRKAEGCGGQGEVPLHELEDGEVGRFLHHMELHRDPGDDEDHDEQRKLFVGFRGHDGFVIGEHPCAQEHDEEHEQETCGHERVAHAVEVVGPVARLVAEAEGRVEHLSRVAYAEHGEHGEGLIVHVEGVSEEGQQKGGHKSRREGRSRAH